jgi:multidrug efflux pump subunit AcrA (membrane-fusion protein)
MSQLRKSIRLVIIIAFLLATIGPSAVGADQPPASEKPMLLLLTSHGPLDDTGKATGYFVPEAAHPSYVLKVVHAYSTRYLRAN